MKKVFVLLVFNILLLVPYVFSLESDGFLGYTSPLYFNYKLSVAGNWENSSISLPGFVFPNNNILPFGISFESSLHQEISFDNADNPIDGDCFRPIKFENIQTWLYTPTYDGTEQAVHPDIVYFSDGWHGYKYWMAMTPYPMSNKNHENPSILVSQDGYIWKVPEGLSNPVVPHQKGGWNADTDLIYNPGTDELWMYYVRFKNNLCTLYRVRSQDGITWSDEEYIFSEPLFQMLSPAIVYKDDLYHLWYVDANSRGIHADYTVVKYRTSVDGIVWSEAQLVDIGCDGCYVWHLDAVYIPQFDEFWMFFPGFSDKIGAKRTVLFFARTNNPTEWITQPEPVLYRSTFIYDEEEGNIRLWYSAARKHVSFILPIYSWHIGYTECAYPILPPSLATP